MTHIGYSESLSFCIDLSSVAVKCLNKLLPASSELSYTQCLYINTDTKPTHACGYLNSLVLEADISPRRFSKYSFVMLLKH